MLLDLFSTPTDKIGGHCIIPNAKLLPRTKLIDGLLDYE